MISTQELSNKVLEIKTFNAFKKSGLWVTDKDENLYNYVDNYLPLILKLKPTNYTFAVNKRYSAYIQSLDMTVPVVEFMCIYEDGSEQILDFVISKEWNDKYNTNMKDYIITPLLNDINY